MAEVITVSNINDMPLEGWDICLDEMASLTEFPCKHKCSPERVRNIDKCHMCPCELNKSKIYKAYIQLILQKSTILRVPFYYDTLNVTVTDVLGIACLMEINNILLDYSCKSCLIGTRYKC